MKLEAEIFDVISLAKSYDLFVTTDSVRKLLDFTKAIVSGSKDFGSRGKKVVCEIKKSGSFSESFVSLSVFVETVKDDSLVARFVEGLKRRCKLDDVVKTKPGEWIKEWTNSFSQKEKDHSFAFVLSLIFPRFRFEKESDDEEKAIPVKVCFELGSNFRLILNEVSKEGGGPRYREVMKEPFWTWWWRYEKKIFAASSEVFKSFLKRIEPVLNEVGSGSLINHGEEFLKVVEEVRKVPFQSLEEYDFVNVVVKRLFEVESFKRFSSEFLSEIVTFFLEDFSEEKDRKEEKEESERRLEDEELGIFLK